jgi:hypothetical protein
MHRPMLMVLLVAASSTTALAADQTVVGSGNALGEQVARASPLIQGKMSYLVEQARRISDPQLRHETLDALTNSHTCIRHRAGLSASDQRAIVDALVAQGLVNPALDATHPGGLLAGVFPPVEHDGSSCPTLPLSFQAAPGSATGSHHAYPGGLPVHEAFNERSDQFLALDYRLNYEASQPDDEHAFFASAAALGIDPDIVIAAPIWHDWTKTMVFQWNADGSEFAELSFGGGGKAMDGFRGAAGDSQTGGHHILAVAESMARGLAPDFVITQACAHSNPTLGNEFKVVNWLRAAALVARIDPIQAGYLVSEGGTLRLPPLRKLSAGTDLIAAGQLNLLPEYAIHNLSDADFTLSIPAVSISDVILPALASEFGYDRSDLARYNWKFRHVVLSREAGERILFAYETGGLAAVRSILQRLRGEGAI